MRRNIAGAAALMLLSACEEGSMPSLGHVGAPLQNPEQIVVVNSASSPVPTTLAGPVGATQVGPWNVEATLAGTPTVALAAGTTIAATLAPGASVSATIAGNPTVRSTGETVQVLSETFEVRPSGHFPGIWLGDIDVSAFRTVRVTAQVRTGPDEFTIHVYSVNDDLPQPLSIVTYPDDDRPFERAVTQVFEVPGRTLGILLEHWGFGSTNVHLTVYGRP